VTFFRGAGVPFSPPRGGQETEVAFSPCGSGVHTWSETDPLRLTEELAAVSLIGILNP
jgi:hypothetical protein